MNEDLYTLRQEKANWALGLSLISLGLFGLSTWLSCSLLSRNVAALGGIALLIPSLILHFMLSKAPKIRFEHPDGSIWLRIRNLAGTHGLRQSSDLTHVRWKDNSAGDNAYDGNALYLYRLWSTNGLISAVHAMKSYLDTPEFYDPGVYKEFLTCMRQSIDLFHRYHTAPTALIQPYDFIQETLDKKEAELRSFASRLAFQVQEPPAEDVNAVTTIHQLPSKLPRAEGDYDHNMSYVIQTRKGKIIIIDGGWEKDNLDGKFLFSYLQQITGDPTPHIDAWFITHAHGDHHGAVSTFANLYADQVTVDAFYHHYPTDSEIEKYLPDAGIDGTKSAVARVPYQMTRLKNAQGGPVKEIYCNTKHSGKCNNSFDFDEVHIDILLTFTDVMWAVDNVSGTYSGTPANEGRTFSNKTFKQLVSGNMNETSLVFRVTVGGKNVLFTGDINYVGGYLLNKFHDIHSSNSSSYYSIKCDYVQVSHHGYYGLPKNTYQRIDPDVALWPTPSYEFNATTSTNKNIVAVRQWFKDMGVKDYPSYLGPQVFQFPLVRSAAAVSIPTELRDYVFDAEYYSSKYPDLAQLYGTNERDLYYHFVNYGIEEGRSASPFFDVRFYANQNGQHFLDTVKGNYVAAFQDFLNKYRTASFMKLSENFDPSVYAADHKELTAQGYTTIFSLLKHYVDNGYQKGEIASKTFLCDDRSMTYHSNCTVTQSVEPTCTTAGKTAGITCNTCGLVLREQQSIPAREHSYEYVDLGEEHRADCGSCDHSIAEAHSYIDGLCICGAVQTFLDQSLVLNHSLNLSSDISVNYLVRTELLEGYDSFYLECVIPKYNGNEQVGTESFTIEPVLNGSYYYFTLAGMTAVQMNDPIEATLYMTEGNRQALSNTDTYSIATYAYNQLNKEGSAEKLKTLCADLLRYGSGAQTFKKYRTDALADAAMTTAHKEWLSDLDQVTFGNHNTQFEELSTPAILWAGKALSLDSKVAVKFVINTAPYVGEISNLSLRLSYQKADGTVAKATLTDAVPYDFNSLYAFEFDGLMAAELRTVIHAAVFAGNTQISNTLQYSADTYGNGKTGDLLYVCKTLFGYSDSAKAFFSP